MKRMPCGSSFGSQLEAVACSRKRISVVASMSVNAPLVALVTEFGVVQRRNDPFLKRVVAILE